MTPMIRWSKTFIVVLTVGRSGSTLLQGILNAIPGVLVRGENNAFLSHLYRAHAALYEAKTEMGGKGSDTPQHPWFGAAELRPDFLLSDIASIVAKQLLAGENPENYSAIGFKEIRWLRETNLHGYLKFLDQIFDDTRFILLTRDINLILQSGWWPKREPAAAREQIENFYHAAESAPVKKLFRIDYAQLVEDSARLVELFAFLGSACPANLADLLAKPHSFGNRTRESAVFL